jgi:Transposase DDE domain group 1
MRGALGRRSTLIFDLDSVVLTLYGQQQGARVGYNPKKKGRRSYHPLLCFEAHAQEFWHGSLRPGDTSANTGVIGFLERCRAKVPSTVAHSRVRIRADCGFFGGKLLGFLEQAGWGYAIVAKQYRTIRHKALSARFQKLGGGWQVAEFFYQATGWPQARRFVVVRRPIPEDPLEAAQLSLLKYQRYAYSILVTNLSLSPWRVWRFYVQRGRVEKTIRELIYDLPLSQIPTGEWLANVGFFQLLMLAYNLVHWFKRSCLPQKYREATVETIRREFFALPGRLIHPGHRHVLQLPERYPLQREFLQADRNIQRLCFQKM